MTLGEGADLRERVLLRLGTLGLREPAYLAGPQRLQVKVQP